MANILIKITPPGIAAVLYLFAWLANRNGFGGPVGVSIPWLGSSLILAGVVILAWAVIQFRRFHTTIIPAGEPSALLNQGPFRFSRNPIYVADLLITSGIALLLGPVVYFAIPIILFIVFRFAYIPSEETRMKNHFGEPYLSYCQRVRRWI